MTDTATTVTDEDDDRVTCEVCEAVVDSSEGYSTDDGWLCPDCLDEAQEAFKRTRYQCSSAACGWSGLGPETKESEALNERECPTCGEFVEDIGEEKPAEVTAP